MSNDPKISEKLIPDLITEIHGLPTKDSRDSLILRLNTQFPNDTGLIATLLLNHLTLKKGQAFSMDPSEPHAYIHGDCIEAMALSDNVVRLGLTPKFKDTKT
jgi:mannose-6-phosphate isomerase